MLPYRYADLPLPAAGKHTRLLRLNPGDFSDDLHVELEQVLLNGTSTYEALSYVWGSPAYPVPILVGPTREHTISVTQNLAIALRHLRAVNEFRTLWVDAVCIDQSDLKERSYQVTLMSDIYQKASQVIVWLGPEDDDSFHAFNLMNAIGSRVDVDWTNYSFKSKVAADNPFSQILVDLQNYQFRDDEAYTINNLLHRQWFKRLWIRQEIWLATRAIIRCGKLVLPWHVFSNAILFLFVQGTEMITIPLGKQIPDFFSRIALATSVCESRAYYFQHLRIELANVVCADPRDKIYGMLSLLHPSQKTMGILPDYTRNVALVYQDATLKFISHTMDLSILLQCEMQDIPPQMPTWVPDWSTDLKTTSISRATSNASADLESIVFCKEEGTLSVAGVAVATIENVQPMRFGETGEDFLTMLTTLWIMVMSNSTTAIDLETSQLSTVCNTLCAGGFRHTSIPNHKHSPDFKSVMQSFKTILATGSILFGDVDSQKEWFSYEAALKGTCDNRSFFVTKGGSVGIAPLSARPGDMVCVLLGCYSTVLLRQTRDDTYQLVGQSYMSGANAGEALLGPLPEHLQPINYRDKQENMYRFALWNEHTGEVQFKDPRLDKLLLYPGFQAHDHGKKHFPTIETSVEALRKAGIAAQYFDLV